MSNAQEDTGSTDDETHSTRLRKKAFAGALE